jgi:hypothetical protein
VLYVRLDFLWILKINDTDYEYRLIQDVN